MTTLRELVTLLGFKVDDAGVQKADAAFGRLQGKANDLMNLVSAASFAYLTRLTGKLSDSLGVAVDLAAAEEDAWHSLMITTEQMGGVWSDIQPKAEAFAKTMMKTTRFADDEAIAALQTYIQMTSDISGSYKAVALAADVATGKHWSLEAAVQAVAFAQTGNLRRLIPLLPEVKNLAEMDLELTDSAKRAEYALGLLNEKFGGQALKALGTYSASMKQVKNWTDQVAESIGDSMIPALYALNMAFVPVLVKLSEVIDMNQAFTGTIVLATKGVSAMLPVAGSLIQTFALMKIAGWSATALLGTIGSFAAIAVPLVAVIGLLAQKQAEWNKELLSTKANLGGAKVAMDDRVNQYAAMMGISREEAVKKLRGAIGLSPEMAIYLDELDKAERGKLTEEDPFFDLLSKQAKTVQDVKERYENLSQQLKTTGRTWGDVPMESLARKDQAVYELARGKMSGGGGGETFHSLITRPPAMMGAGATITSAPTIIQNIDARGADPEAVKKAAFEGGRDALQWELHHVKNNLITPQ